MENRLVVANGEVGGSGTDWELGVSRCKLFHLEWGSNTVLPVQHRGLCPVSWIDHDGKRSFKNYVVLILPSYLVKVR